MNKNTYNLLRKELKRYLINSPFIDKTYCVGGCVRDYLLDREIKDIDLVVEIPGGGLKLAVYLYSLGVLEYPPVIYKNYGVSQIRFLGYDIEIVQTRNEEYVSRESRNPKVCYGTLEEDWKRRDFTINSLYQSLSDDKIHDLSGKGLEDLGNKVIRTTSDPGIIFDDDPLRMLRCIRFSSVLGFRIDGDTWSGVCKNHERLSIISRERVTSELEKILVSDNPSYGLDLLRTSGLLRYISEDLYLTTIMTQNKYHIGTVWEHTLAVVEKCKNQESIILWSALFHDIGKLCTKTIDSSGRVHFLGHAEVGSEMCKYILSDFKLPGEKIKLIQELVARHMDFKSYSPDLHNLKDKTLRRIQYILGEEQFRRLLILIEADNMSHAPGYCIEGQIDKLRERTESMKTMFDYRLPITGEDIMKVRNIGPGKLVRGYLEYALKLAFVNPDISREELLKRIKNLSPKKLGKKWEAYI